MTLNPDDETTDAALEANSETALRADLDSARERVDRLVLELRETDERLEAMAVDCQRYRSLQQAFDVLTDLGESGASALFWEGLDAHPDDHLRQVRSRVDEFDKQLHEVEEHRQMLLDTIQLEEDVADDLSASILEAERLEEERLNEWLMERDDPDFFVRESNMPWMRGGEDDRRFRKTLAVSLLLTLFLGAVLPLIDIPIPAKWEVLEEQERMTQLLRKEIPKPAPKPVEIAKPEPTAPANETPILEESPDTVAAEELIAEAAPAPTKAEKPSARSKGILAFREKFSSLAQTDPVARLGSNARIQDPSNIASGLPERSMVTSQAGTTSGGINIASLSRGTGGAGKNLGGVAVAQATSSIGTGTGIGAGAGGDRPLSGGGPGLGRTDEEIQIVFDRHKAALYRMYNRALRKNPTLRGQIVLRLTIEPDGSVSMCEQKSSDMKAPDLSKQVVSRVRSFDFGAKEGVAAITIAYPIDFLPAT